MHVVGAGSAASGLLSGQQPRLLLSGTAAHLVAGVACRLDARHRLAAPHDALVAHVAARLGPLYAAGRDAGKARWAGGQQTRSLSACDDVGDNQWTNALKPAAKEHCQTLKPHLLVLDQDARQPRCRVAAHGALDVDGVAVAGVSVADDCSWKSNATRVGYGRWCGCAPGDNRAGLCMQQTAWRQEARRARHALGRRRVASVQLRAVSAISANDMSPALGKTRIEGEEARVRRRLEREVQSQAMRHRPTAAATQPASEPQHGSSTPVSGAPRRAAAVQKPLMKPKSKPARSISRADRPSWQQGPCLRGAAAGARARSAGGSGGRRRLRRQLTRFHAAIAPALAA